MTEKSWKAGALFVPKGHQQEKKTHFNYTSSGTVFSKNKNTRSNFGRRPWSGIFLKPIPKNAVNAVAVTCPELPVLYSHQQSQPSSASSGPKQAQTHTFASGQGRKSTAFHLINSSGRPCQKIASRPRQENLMRDNPLVPALHGHLPGTVSWLTPMFPLLGAVKLFLSSWICFLQPSMQRHCPTSRVTCVCGCASCGYSFLVLCQGLSLMYFSIHSPGKDSLALRTAQKQSEIHQTQPSMSCKPQLYWYYPAGQRSAMLFLMLLPYLHTVKSKEISPLSQSKTEKTDNMDG